MTSRQSPACGGGARGCGRRANGQSLSDLPGNERRPLRGERWGNRGGWTKGARQPLWAEGERHLQHSSTGRRAANRCGGGTPGQTLVLSTVTRQPLRARGERWGNRGGWTKGARQPLWAEGERYLQHSGTGRRTANRCGRGRTVSATQWHGQKSRQPVRVGGTLHLRCRRGRRAGLGRMSPDKPAPLILRTRGRMPTARRLSTARRVDTPHAGADAAAVDVAIFQHR